LKVNISPIQEFISQLRISFLGDDLLHKYDNEKAPIRSELFSLEQLEAYARTLAATHHITEDKPSEQLLKRLAENEEILLEVHNLLTASAKENKRITPAGEWLLDNFYLIEEQIYTGKKHLPKGYSKGLPPLADGPSAGLPRVYDLAVEMIAHTDGRVDLKSLLGFTMAYQEVSELKLGELWAIPIMLRLALIENLRRLAALIAKNRINKNLADYWADQMTETAEKDPKSLILVIADMARYGPPLESSFVAELTRRLVGKGAAFSLPISWIEQRLSEKGMTSDELVNIENQKQAADQVSISNSIGSLRFLGSNNWRDFVENISVVENIFKTEKSGIYPLMDFLTRDEYRHRVEKISKYSLHSESAIARMAMENAVRNERERPDYEPAHHLGYFLVGKGYKKLVKEAGARFPFPDRLKNFFKNIPLLTYAGSVICLALLMSATLLYNVWSEGHRNPWLISLTGLIVWIGCSQLAVSLINWIGTLIVKPLVLPRMDYSLGIPEDYKTLVAIPSMFSHAKELDDLVENLEVRFLANRGKNIHFALLTDFKDAKSEVLPEDEDLLRLARQRIEALNVKYGSENNGLFFIFHRPRKYNPREKAWMGYERKRGKLSELNALLRGKGEESFMLILGDPAVYQKIKYVITLDTDTQLPRDAAWKITGTMAHPLNHPRFSERKQRVVEGYGILQPRVAVSLPYSESTPFVKLHGNEPGIDPYTRAVSDVYQDIFGEGSFIGKGIYDVDAFEKALAGRFPENRILSHDLLEGSYVRCGLLSDVQLYEAYPLQYDVDMKRRHRWIRGDWQIASWLLPWVPGPAHRILRNPVSALSKWKIFDNIRRSLVPLALLGMLIYGWVVSHSPLLWSAAVVTILLLNAMILFLWELRRKPEDIRLDQHIYLSLKFSIRQFANQLLLLITIPYEAFLYADAIWRTNWRMLISHRHLLQWNPSQNLINRGNKSLGGTYAMMWFPVVLAIGVFGWMQYRHPAGLAISLPFLISWILMPAICWKISLQEKGRIVHLDARQKNFLYKLSRKTWAFFETFIVEGDNWLPPDNYQESPVERTAHRTSPTNIGLALLANLTALDFGYISMQVFLLRTSNTLQTMQKMEKYAGHFYNWYDTQTLRPLPPNYVSTVDSGNLAGHLITLKQGLLMLAEQPLIPQRIFRGFLTTLEILQEKMGTKKGTEALEKRISDSLDKQYDQVTILFEDLTALLNEAEDLNRNFNDESETTWWADALSAQIRDICNEVTETATWLSLSSYPERFGELFAKANHPMTLQETAFLENQLLVQIQGLDVEGIPAEEKSWLDNFRHQLIETSRRAKERMLSIQSLSRLCDEFADIQFDFLYDKSQRLVSIGYNVTDHRRDNSFYDLLASEARLALFLGIAQGKLPQDSWFALGRQLTNTGTSPILISWSGSMFEYLMPLLVMPGFENTLLDQTNRAMVQKQIEYGKKRNVPWGVSESGYNLVDVNLNYQYRAFGVPGLGLKRGLGEDLVIAPYSSVMALMVQPEQAVDNLIDMESGGFAGRYGMYEAIDYTAARLTRGQQYAIVRSFMVHHQGMGFLSLSYLLHDKPMQKRFENEPQFKAVMLLLQERIPQATEFYSPSVHVSDTSITEQQVEMRVVRTPHTPVPEIQLLSNGRYHAMISNSGSGYSRWKDISVTRWKEDATLDNTGFYCYIRDLDNDSSWSASYQPSLKNPESYEVVFSQGRAEFRRLEQNFETHTEIVVSSEDDVEMRRIHISNRSRRRRLLEVTSYAEVVLTSAAADSAHPAFSNLFVQTELLPQRDAILCTRRPRGAGDPQPWLFHLMKVHNTQEIRNVSFETDRAAFIGRTKNLQEPDAMNSTKPLTNSQGAVLDPIVAIRYQFVIEPHDAVTVDLVMGVSDNRDGCTYLVQKYQDRPLIDRAFELAWTHSQVVLRQINASEADAQLYSRLASSVIYSNPALRADPSIIIRNRRGQSGLWSYSISGDIPIVLLQIQDVANIELARQLVQAHAYWRLKGMIVDLVIWNEDFGGYRQALQNELLSLISPGIISDVRDRPGGIFIRSGEQVSQEDRILFQAVARVILSDTLGTLDEQLKRRSKVKTTIPYFTPSKFYATLESTLPLPKDLLFYNGQGGFSADGTEYHIITGAGRPTPAPWTNILANPVFGCVISESGQSYSWMDNAHEYRLTPWNNDSVTDFCGEAFYLRDEESGKYWSPSPLPAPGKSVYHCVHGMGYSEFNFAEDGIFSSMTVFTDTEQPLKFIQFKIRNQSGRTRRLSVTGYVEWVLGDLRPKTNPQVITEFIPDTGVLIASNAYSGDFGGYCSFFDTDDTSRTFTTDRSEFLGRNGTYKNPEALGRAKLSGRTGATLDPCAVLQTVVELKESEERTLVFRLGAGRNRFSALDTAKNFRGALAAAEALTRVREFWKKTLSAIQVSSPDPSIDILFNGWLNYQTLASRIWGRSGFYQSGGAFGFRDQLQDSISLLHSRPDLVREQILLSASRQFREGDVQHWWHPPLGRGVRTTCSDDYLWLPYVVSRYVRHTGDESILDEKIRFIEGRLLNPGEDSNYELPVVTEYAGTLYEHCELSVRHGIRYGTHGLPLMGSGDWNDGMDKVGHEGKGESVWLAFFFYDVLMKFQQVAKLRKDEELVSVCEKEAQQLRKNIELNGWDGNWYLRAFFDDGTPLGSSHNEECRIDSIPQSWSVISGAGNTTRSRTGLQSAYKNLVRKDIGVIQLFDPPFNQAIPNPGYIRGYLPGVRENGGQYTHAAIWMIMAKAALEDKAGTYELIRLINPITHGSTEEKIKKYRTEPYVIAADVYAVENRKGMGGWTWYTGSAGWMYQLLAESFFGLKRAGNRLSFKPCIPDEWTSFEIRYRFGETVYHLQFERKDELKKINLLMDGVRQEGEDLLLVNDKNTHQISILLPGKGIERVMLEESGKVLPGA